MATIIDTLLVKLGLDSAEFTAGKSKVDKGLKETGSAAENAGKKLKDAGTGGAKGFDEVAKSAAKFLAVIGGAAAIKSFISHVIESDSALDRFAKNLDRSVQTVSAWSNATELAGGSAAGLQGTMDMLSKSQTELMLTGQSGLIPYLSALGVSLADTQGKARPVDDLLLDLSDRFAKMDRSTANNMGRMMGLDPGTMHLLLKGRTEVELMVKRQKEYGAVSKKQAEEASKLHEQIVRGKQVFAAFGRELMGMALPAIQKLFQALGGAVDWMVNNKEFVTTFLTILAAGLAAVALAAMPINVTALAITGLAAAIALLWQDYQTWKRGGDSLIDWAKWQYGINIAKTALTTLRDVARDAFYRIFAAADMANKAVHGDWKGAKFAWGEVVAGAPSDTPAAGGKSLPRGIRNNNPGNLNFAGQAGATKEGGPNGRFAVFGSMQQGVAALVRQIGLYVGRGKNTVRSILETYAPSTENNTGAYIAAVANALGIGPDDPLDPSNASQVKGLVRAIVDHENGRGHVSEADITGGFQIAMGKPGASQFARGAGASQVAMASAPAAPGAAGSNSVETHIGEVNVYSSATDADGIAKDMGKSLEFLFTPQANYGMVS